MHTPIRSRNPKSPLLLQPPIFFLILFLGGCAGHERVLNPEYANARFSDKTLMVFGPDSTNIMIGNPDDLLRCFPKEKPIPAKERFAQEFNDAFLQSLRNHADYIRIAPAPESLVNMAPAMLPDSQRISFVQSKNPDLPAFTYILPTHAWLAVHGAEADLGLFVRSLRSELTDALVENPKVGGVHQTSLIVEGRYIIWDYAKNLVVAYGRFRSDIGFGQSVRTKDWMKAFEKAGRQVVERSPFKGEKWLKLEE